MKLRLKLSKFKELLNLTVNQRSTLLGDDVDAFTRILERKERIIKELNSIDSSPVELRKVGNAHPTEKIGEEKFMSPPLGGVMQMEQDVVGLSEELHKIMIEISEIEKETIFLLTSNLQKVGKELKEMQQIRQLRRTYSYALLKEARFVDMKS